MKYFVTRNRRNELPTNQLDAWDDKTYLGVCNGYEVVDNSIVIKFGDTEIKEEKNMNTVEVAPGVYLSQDIMTRIAPKVEEFTGDKSYTVEFNWQMGSETIEGFTSVGSAKAYKDEVEKKFNWAKIEDFKVYEVKSIRKEIL
jgi:hypothetical protein